MHFTGTIVEESLKDIRFLNQTKVIGMRISPEENSENVWHLYKVSIEEAAILELSRQLKSEQWYAHFWDGDTIVAVFPGKTFQFKYSDRSTWSDAIKYGKSLNIPEVQLDFIIE